tara:strand:- start:2173 stop:2535 length:363 start_codon:yes stop_codon:yes gene_type:complete
LVSEHQHKGLSLLGRDERASRDDDDPLSPTPERKKKATKKSGRERERERLFLERTFFSRVVFRLIKDGETIKELWCVLFAYFQHTNTGYFQLLMETTPREREREKTKTKRTPVSRSTYSM